MELIQNINNTLPQQVEENRKNILIIGDNIFIVTDKGQWNNNYTYKRGDLVYVTSNGVDYSFVCVKESLNIEPLVNQHYLQYWRRWGGVDGVTPIINAQAVTVPYTQEASVEKTGDQYNMTYTFYIPRGYTGATPQFAIGTITTLPAGSQATVTITGSTDNPILNFGIPIGNKGDKGDKGDTGATPQFSIGSVTPGAYNQAEVNISGSAESPILNFVLPRGEKGDTGNTPVIAIGTVTTLLPSQQAYVNIGGTADYPILNFGIPKGETGINSGVIYDSDVMGDSSSTYSTNFLNNFALGVYQQLGTLDGTLSAITSGTSAVPVATDVNSTINGHAITNIFESDGETAKDAMNVKSKINDVNISDIFESDGYTVKHTCLSNPPAWGIYGANAENKRGKWVMINFSYGASGVDLYTIVSPIICFIDASFLQTNSDCIIGNTYACDYYSDTNPFAIQFRQYQAFITGNIGSRVINVKCIKDTFDLDNKTRTRTITPDIRASYTVLY